jgi:hypothetical protein
LGIEKHFSGAHPPWAAAAQDCEELLAGDKIWKRMVFTKIFGKYPPSQ